MYVFEKSGDNRILNQDVHSFPTRRSSDLLKALLLLHDVKSAVADISKAVHVCFIVSRLDINNKQKILHVTNIIAHFIVMGGQ